MSGFDDLIGHDLNRKMADFVKESSKDFERDRRVREEQIVRGVSATDELWLMLTKLGSRQGEPDRYRAECVSGLPAGVPELVVQGESAQDCVFNARWELVGHLRRAKLCATQEDARARAARAEINCTLGL